ncbi:MAG: FHA domain-containing protein [Planctomycetota bacterium]
MGPESAVENPFFGTLSFWLWLAAVVLGIVLLLLMYLNSLRKEKKISFFVPGEVFGALLGRNDLARGRQILIVRGGLIIGRIPETCDIVCDNTAVSREHAKVYPIGGRVVLVDLKSKNGTYVNGMRITQHELSDGDVISLGKKKPTIFEYRR